MFPPLGDGWMDEGEGAGAGGDVGSSSAPAAGGGKCARFTTVIIIILWSPPPLPPSLLLRRRLGRCLSRPHVPSCHHRAATTTHRQRHCHRHHRHHRRRHRRPAITDPADNLFSTSPILVLTDDPNVTVSTGTSRRRASPPPDPPRSTTSSYYPRDLALVVAIREAVHHHPRLQERIGASITVSSSSLVVATA